MQDLFAYPIKCAIINLHSVLLVLGDASCKSITRLQDTRRYHVSSLTNFYKKRTSFFLSSMIYFMNKILQEGCLFMSEYKMSQINVSKIKKAVEAEIPILITTYTLPHDMELYIREVITFYLKELHQEQIGRAHV